MSVALTDCPKVAPLSEFICLSILALTFSQLFPRAARFSRVDRRDDWRHYRAAPTARQPKQGTHNNAHTLMWMTGASVCTHTHSIVHTSQRYEIRWPNNYPGLISIIMIYTGSSKSDGTDLYEGHTWCVSFSLLELYIYYCWLKEQCWYFGPNMNYFEDYECWRKKNPVVWRINSLPKLEIY